MAADYIINRKFKKTRDLRKMQETLESRERRENEKNGRPEIQKKQKSRTLGKSEGGVENLEKTRD